MPKVVWIGGITGSYLWAVATPWIQLVLSRRPARSRPPSWWMLLLACCLATSSGGLLAQVSVSGPQQIRLGGTGQYTATVGGFVTSVLWSVNGVANGTTSTGTITAAGLYTPATTIFAGHSVTVTATTTGAPAVSASLSVKMVNPLPVFAYATVSAVEPPGTYLLDVFGANFVPTSQVVVAGANVATTYISATQLECTISLPSGTVTFKAGVTNPNTGQSAPVGSSVTLPPALQATIPQASRLLDQATFGPTLASIQQVQQIGQAAWINQQFAAPATLMPAIGTPPVALCPDATFRCAQNYFWQAALTANDQLRQRVAFALSEIFVVSTNEVNARSIPSFQNVLVTDAFTNFQQIMSDVSVTPAMGAYLNMLNSPVAPAGQIANENYARELMQLFSTGLYLLNADGTPQLNAQGQTQPVYTEAQVQAYARALTGWTYSTSTGAPSGPFPNGYPEYDYPLRAVESQHDMTAKLGLNGVTLPAGQTAEQDLAGVISSIFNHPNVGPFVCRQLIQHLVASNPSPAYIARVSAVFANNGAGVRGDMKSVITAILMDPEARAGDTNPEADGGHLREPVLYFTGVMRGLEFTNVNPQGRYDNASSYTALLDQTPYAANSVFNFFPPTYVVPGTSLYGPEFALENTATQTLRLTLADSIVRNHLTSYAVDLTQTSFLGQIASVTGIPATDSANLVNSLNVLFLHGQMPAAMQNAIVAEAITLSDIGQRVRLATWLVISSNLYKVEH